MTLFESDSRYREKFTIWRILSTLPLFGDLSEGNVWKWFAVNIPMDLGTGGGKEFTSDIDIITCLRNYPNTNELHYKTWEVKVTLLKNDGTARSLKKAKIPQTLNQLHAYKNFGAPVVTLMKVFVCEDGFMLNNDFPSRELNEVIVHTQDELIKEGFGFQMLPFEHGKEENIDVGLMVMRENNMLPGSPIAILQPKNFGLRQPFSRLVYDINRFYKEMGDIPRKPFKPIIYCKKCKKLQMIDMKTEFECPNCKDNLIVQN